MAPTTPPIQESDKRRLTEYLIERVISGISGRNGEDIVDITPSRAIFAGVLQPSRQTVVQSAKGADARGEASSGTALGLDFRVRAEATGEPIRLNIAATWCNYYPVFPTWEQIQDANGVTTAKPKQATSDSVEPSPDGSVVNVPLTDLDEILTGDNADVEEDAPDTATGSAPSGTVMMPRVFRRYSACVEPIAVTLRPGESTSSCVGERELASTLSAVRLAIEGDLSGRRHLGMPKDGETRIVDNAALKDKESYIRVLKTLSGKKVAPPPWSCSIQVVAGPDPRLSGVLRIRVLFANTTPGAGLSEDIDRQLEERAFLDARLQIDISGGTVVPFEFLLAPKDYRSKPQMPAKGINCVADWDPQRPNHLASESIPLFKQPLYRTRDALRLTFYDLAAGDYIERLDSIADKMREYLNAWDEFLCSGAPGQLSPDEIAECRRDRDRFAVEIDRYTLGIEVLRNDSKLSTAFSLMNHVFDRMAEASKGRVQAWRMFQVGFIVSQLPALAVRELAASANDEYAARVRSCFEEVGVLWFPTGGGKTEAYLGLIAVCLIYDRLRGKGRGVSAWMRFPLRMLSLQQLERLARVIARLNELRDEVVALQAGDPFAIGYYVGDAVTPNSMSEETMRRYEQDKELRNRARLLRKCPHCSGAVEIRPLRPSWRLAHVCTNQQCFSNTAASLRSHVGMLPLCVVDSEIYRYLPAVLVGTVDKLAIVGRNHNFAHIVRGAKQQCPHHGYASYDKCIEAWSAGCKASKKDMVRLEPIKDPGPALLIQDELHLLREDLGVFNGHYEGLLKYLGSRAFMPPKVLAATATIEAYDTHAFHVYLSKAMRFPQPGWDERETFYATARPAQYRRFYVGVLAHTPSVEEPVLRLLGLYIREIRRLKNVPRDAAAAMGRQDLDDKSIQDVLRLYDLCLAYVNRKATGGSLMYKTRLIENLLDTEGLGGVEACLLTGDRGSDVVAEVLERIEAERSDTNEPRLDLVTATSLISHGVDLERINMMVMCGMPSHYAEYVQSTSRTGRSHPGIVFVCFKGREPRELSQYEFYPSMHEHMDRLIEAVAVNRFASFAPQKTVPGLLAGVLTCSLTPDLFGTKITKPLDDVPTLQIALGLKPGSATGSQAGCIRKDHLLQALIEIIGADQVRPPASPAQVENVRRGVTEVFEDQLALVGRALDNRLADVINPLLSFRDVDEGIDFASPDAAGIIARLEGR